VLVLEPSLPGGALKTSRKGCGAYHLVVNGRAAHAGIEPEKGASAVHELGTRFCGSTPCRISNAASRSMSYRCRAVCGRTSFRPGRATVDVRVPTEEAAAEIDAAFRRSVRSTSARQST